MKKRFWRCYLCEKNIYDEEMKGPLLLKEKLDEFFICYHCARDLGWKNIEQKRYILLECPKCIRAFLPLLDFDTGEYHSKVMLCPFCKEKSTFKFEGEPYGSIMKELSPEEFKNLNEL